MDARAPLGRCDDCPFGNRCFVPGDGPPETNWVIVGQAPADTECAKGKPFVGVAGTRLNKALRAARVDRSAVYITNTVLCQPPGNQSPPPPEAISACHERLISEIRLRMPRKVLALGKTAAEALTGDPRTIEQLRLLRPAPSPYLRGYAEVRVTYHPSALTRDPEWPGRFDGDIGWLSPD
jgi:uracil-DNA glycosylase family 4